MLTTPAIEGQLERERLIGLGFTSEVFSWGEDRVLKLSFPWRPLAKIELEFAVSRAVHAAGIRAPEAFDIVRVRERHGILFERASGPSLYQQVEKRPWTLFAAARQLAELHAQLHDCPAPPSLPGQRAQVEAGIDGAVDFSFEEKQAAKRHLPESPTPECVCHGDFHPANIILTSHGPLIIDWSTGTRGHGLADVAQTSVLFECAPIPSWVPVHMRLLMKVARRLLHTAYLRRYLELRHGDMQEIELWRVAQRMGVSGRRAEQDRLRRKCAQ